MSSLSSKELVYVLILGVLAFGVVLKGLYSKNYYALWSPMVLVSAIFIYYTIVGPLIALQNGDTYYKLLEHRSFMVLAWQASLLSFSFMLIGFSITSRPFMFFVNGGVGQVYDPDLFKKYGLRLYGLGFGLFTIFAGSSISSFLNPFSGGYEEVGYRGSLENYLVLAINFFVPALCFMLFVNIKEKLSWTLWLVLLVFAISIYTTFAFRYRHIVLLVSLSSTYFLYTQKRPNKLLMVGVGIGIVTLMGIIEQTRTYFGGLNLDGIENQSSGELFLSGFGESRTFMTLGLMIDRIPETTDFIYFEPYIQGLVIPVPRAIWPGKPSGEHLDTITGFYPTGAGAGAAWPVYGEYYFAFGWLGIMIGSFFLGILFKKMYLWMVNFHFLPIVIVSYSVALGCIYFVISRGYFPQHVMLFFFTIFPCYVVYSIMRKNQNSNSLVENKFIP